MAVCLIADAGVAADAMQIAVLGAGAWGAALAISLAARHAVRLYARSAAQRETLARTRRSTYLAEVPIPASVEIAATAESALDAADLIVVATPVAGLHEILAVVAATSGTSPVVWVCKGFEQDTGRLPHEIAHSVLGGSRSLAVLSGPSFALEVARGLPAAVTLAAVDESVASALARVFHHDRFRVYSTTDMVGVEVGGAVKNVMAIATGIADGLGLGLNARAALITRGLAEVTRLGVALGGRAATFMGLAGAGDLILTCTGDLSRNRRVGMELASGLDLPAVLARLGHVAEGVLTARAVAMLAARNGIDMPITAAVCSVLFDDVRPADAVQALLARDPRAEA